MRIRTSWLQPSRMQLTGPAAPPAGHVLAASPVPLPAHALGQPAGPPARPRALGSFFNWQDKSSLHWGSHDGLPPTPASRVSLTHLQGLTQVSCKVWIINVSPRAVGAAEQSLRSPRLGTAGAQNTSPLSCAQDDTGRTFVFTEMLHVR